MDIKSLWEGPSWWSGGLDSMLSNAGAQVRSLIRELRSLMLHGQKYLLG